MSGVVGPKEMVVTTAFYVKHTNEGRGPQSKPVFTTASAVFSRFEQLHEVMEWAKSHTTENGKLLKVELAPNSR